MRLCVSLTWHISQSGCFCAEGDVDGSPWRRENRRCFPASLLAQCTRRSHASHSVASSAQQKTVAASAAHTSHCSFIMLPAADSTATDRFSQANAN
jgi:hypothetical protein